MCAHNLKKFLKLQAQSLFNFAQTCQMAKNEQLYTAIKKRVANCENCGKKEKRMCNFCAHVLPKLCCYLLRCHEIRRRKIGQKPLKKYKIEHTCVQSCFLRPKVWQRTKKRHKHSLAALAAFLGGNSSIFYCFFGEKRIDFSPVLGQIESIFTHCFSKKRIDFLPLIL